MRTLLFILVFACSTLFTVGQARAVPMLTLNAPDRVSAGSNFEVTIGLSGMETGVDLGAFQFDFFYTPKDRANLQLSDTRFGDQLGDRAETILGLNIFDVGSAKKIEVYEVSLLLDLSWQPVDFDLITFGIFIPRFTGPENQILGILANNFVLSDALGNQIFTENSQVGKFIIAVPEPTTFVLIIVGLLGMRWITRYGRLNP